MTTAALPALKAASLMTAIADAPQVIDPTKMTGDEIREMVKSQRTPKPEPREEAEAEPEPVEAKAAAPAPEAQQTEVEEELPKGVTARIAKEVEKQAQYQARIDEAVRARKAKEKELAELEGQSGSAPAKTPPPANNAPPEEPDLDTFEGTNAEYKAAVQKWKADYREWLNTETTGTVRAEFVAQRAREEAERVIKEAETKHGPEFAQRRAVVAKGSGPGLQAAISELDDWSLVVNHLGQNPEELAEISQLFEANPVKAVTRLGKLEDKLTAAVKPQDAPAKEKLPAPIAPTGGKTGAARAKSLDEAIASGDVSATRNIMIREGVLKARKSA